MPERTDRGRQAHHLRSRVDRMRGITHRETYARDEILGLVEGSGAVIASTRFESKPSGEPGQGGHGQLDALMQRLREHVELVADSEAHPALAQELAALERDARAEGFESAPGLLIVARRPASR